MYVAGEAIRLIQKNDIRLVKEKKPPVFNKEESTALANYESKLDKSTKFIPNWVKVAVALALGLGTMVGWKRVVHHGRRKKSQGTPDLMGTGRQRGLVTMATIFAADTFGLPVSTTHILSSGVAGTMAANGSGLRMSTIRSDRRRSGSSRWRQRRCSPPALRALPLDSLSPRTLYFFFTSSTPRLLRDMLGADLQFLDHLPGRAGVAKSDPLRQWLPGDQGLAVECLLSVSRPLTRHARAPILVFFGGITTPPLSARSPNHSFSVDGLERVQVRMRVS